MHLQHGEDTSLHSPERHPSMQNAGSSYPVGWVQCRTPHIQGASFTLCLP